MAKNEAVDILPTASFVLERSSCHRYCLDPSRDEVNQHRTGIWSIVVQILSADSKQGQLPHEFFILRAAMLAVDEIEFLDIRRILDNTAQLTLVCGRFFIAHIYPDTFLAQLFIYDAAILIAAIVALPANHMRMVLF